jgi:type VI secretion system protein ImpI
MGLHLKIENVPNLPDGGPVEITVTGKRGIDIGRDSHLDWSLPDPTRHISGKHAEIRYKDGGYWLHDVSTNGTFLYGSDHRMQAPRRLRSGDRFTIGHYIIVAALDEETDVPPPAAQEEAARPVLKYQELWSMPGDVPPPIDPKQLRPGRQASPVRPGFLDWAADVPSLDGPVAPAPPNPTARHDLPAGVFDEMDWARGATQPLPEPPQPPPMPAPRRPTGASGETAEVPSVSFAPAGGPAPVAADGAGEFSPARMPPPSAGSRDVEEFLRHLARAAGVSEQVFAQRNSQEVAEQMGEILRLVVDNLSQLLNARMQAKRLMRSASHTVIQATDNNPLKFSPSAEDALRIMFAPPARSYMNAAQALTRSFEDIKTHNVKTYSAMQRALTTLLAELDPETVNRETEPDRGISAVVSSRKAKLWDVYVARWQAKQRSESGGLLDAFMVLFARYYDEQRP